MNFLGMGPMEVIIVLLVAFIFLGPERMIDAARMLGKGMSELRRFAAELPSLDDLGREDIVPDAGRPGHNPAGKGAHESQPSQTSAQSDGTSPGSPEANGDDAGSEAPVAFKRGEPAQDLSDGAGEIAAPEEKRWGRQAPITEHILELRRRLMWSAIAVLVATGIAFAFHQQILSLLMAPAQGFTDIPNQKPIYTDLTEFIGIAMKASLLVGLFASLPFVLFQVVMFVAPGLTPAERRYLYLLMPLMLLSFVVGAAFGYRVLFPPAVHFLLTFGSDVATPFIRIGNYVNLMISLLFWMGVVFETPVVLFFLAKIGVVTPQFLAKQRRYALVIAFILGALITPTFDPINQALVAVPVYILYEISIWLTKLARPARKGRELEPNAER